MMPPTVVRCVLPRTPLLRLSENPRPRLQCALAGRKRETFRSISPSVYCQTHARIVAHTPFRTVSLGISVNTRYQNPSCRCSWLWLSFLFRGTPVDLFWQGLHA